MKTKHVLIGLGVIALGVTATVLIIKYNKNKKNKQNEGNSQTKGQVSIDDNAPKGMGEVSAYTKQANKIVFVKK